MHELPVTESILEIALKHAETAGAARITDIYLVIGALSSIIDDSIQFYWDMLCQGTPAEGANLHFERLELVMKCVSCQHQFTPEAMEYVCPQCGGTGLEIIQGNEFYMDSIQVVSEEEEASVRQEEQTEAGAMGDDGAE